MERTSEAFELLALSKSTSSDEESPARIVRKKQRRLRSRSGNTYRAKSQGEKNVSCNKLLFSASSLFGFGLVGWVLILTWFAVQLRLEMQYLTSLTNKVTAGNQEIPDAIQRCHTLTKQLEQNQTHIVMQLQQVVQKQTDFSNMLRGIESDLSSVKKKLNDTPDLASIPKRFQELMDSVAKFGGQLADFNVTTMNEQKKISDQIDNINKNLSLCNILQEELQNVKNDSYGKNAQSSENKSEALFQTILNYITPNISSLNSTVSKKIDEIIEDHRETQDTINNFKARLEAVHQEEQDLYQKVLKDIKEKTIPLQAAIDNCTHDSDLKMELLRNLTHQVTNCACTGEKSTNDLHRLLTSTGTESLKKEKS